MNESAWMEVDLDVLSDNGKQVIDFVQSYNSSTKVLAVVKADGYGHGAIETARVFERVGIDYLGVATINEGVELRKAGITIPILVFGYVYHESYELALANNLTLTIYDPQLARDLEAKGRELGLKPRVHIKVDVGMTRLGLPLHESSSRMIKDMCNLDLEVEGIYGHFPLADSADDTITVQQAEDFKNFVYSLDYEFPLVHLCNSAGMMRLPEYHFDMVRAGGILYGHFCLGHFINESIIATRRAMSIRARIGNIREVPSHTGVSYGWLHKTDKNTKIAAIPLGYTDGIHRSNTNKATFLCKGEWINQVGLICMDQLMVDVGNLSDVKIGDIVTLLGIDNGQEISLEQRAREAGIGKCELFAGIGTRLTKFYIENGKIIKRKNRLLL